MPIGGMDRGKSPGDAASRQTILNVEIVGNVIVVVKIHEAPMKNRPIGKRCQQAERKDQQQLVAGARESHWVFPAPNLFNSSFAGAKSGLSRRASLYWSRAASDFALGGQRLAEAQTNRRICGPQGEADVSNCRDRLIEGLPVAARADPRPLCASGLLGASRTASA